MVKVFIPGLDLHSYRIDAGFNVLTASFRCQ
jgi:hypothetical protein